MKYYSTIMEALEKRIERIPLGKVVKLSEILGGHKEPEIVAGAKILLMKYGIKYE